MNDGIKIKTREMIMNMNFELWDQVVIPKFL